MPTVNPAVKAWTTESDASVSKDFRALDYLPIELYTFTTSPDATDLDAYTASGLPAPGQLYPGTFNVYAERAQLKRLSPILWQAIVRYKGAVDSSGGPASNPLDQAAIVDWDDVEIEEEIDQDFDGNPIQTPTGEKIFGVKASFYDSIARVQKNMLLFDNYTASAYRRAVNSDTFLGWPPGTVRCKKLSAKSIKNEYYSVTGIFQCRIPYNTTAAKAWYSRVRLEGFEHFISLYGSVKKVRAVDKLKQPTTKPVLLDENGFRLPEGDPPVWVETKKYDSLPFAALGFF